MDVTVTFRQGPEADLPDDATSGEPLWCTDSHKLYVSTGSGTVLIGPDAGGSASTITFTAPTIFSVVGSPATGDATIALSLANQSKNLVFAGPVSGSDTVPTFRYLEATDIPGGDTWADEQWLWWSDSLQAILSGTISVVAGTGLDDGGTIDPVTGSVTINLADTAVTPGDYGGSAGIPTFTVDQQGRLTGAGTVSVSGASTVDYGSIVNLTGDRLLGRDASGTGPATLITVGGGLTFTGANGIQISQQVGLSVFGRTTNTTGTMAAIVASSDGDVLRRSGTSLAFGPIDTASIGSGTLGVARGGTGHATFTLGDTLYASDSVTLSRRAISTNGRVWTVVSGVPDWAAPVTATNGSATLGSAYSITASAGTYADTGLSITLPGAGTFLVIANVRGAIEISGGTDGNLTAKLYNSTDGADVTDSERMVIRTEDVNTLHEATAPIHAIVTVAASKVIKLYALRNGGGSPTFTTSQIASGVAGRTTLHYLQLAP